MMQYHIWTYGCQMNTADSQLLASELEKLGHQAATNPDDADILVVNTCVVRQSAEDKGFNRLSMLKGLKRQEPDRIIGMMGCGVGVRDPLYLRQRVPYVDVFMPPSDPKPMIEFLHSRVAEDDAIAAEMQARSERERIQDGELDFARSRTR